MSSERAFEGPERGGEWRADLYRSVLSRKVSEACACGEMIGRESQAMTARRWWFRKAGIARAKREQFVKHQ